MKNFKVLITLIMATISGTNYISSAENSQQNPIASSVDLSKLPKDVVFQILLKNIDLNSASNATFLEQALKPVNNFFKLNKSALDLKKEFLELPQIKELRAKILINNYLSAHQYAFVIDPTPSESKYFTYRLELIPLCHSHMNGLQGAVARNDIEFLNKVFTLLTPEQKLDLINKKNNRGYALLYYAINTSKNPNIIALLIDNGADVNIPDPKGYFPLYHGFKMAETAVNKILLHHTSCENIKKMLDQVDFTGEKLKDSKEIMNFIRQNHTCGPDFLK